MHRYETSTPRVAFGIAAVAMMAITIGVLVFLPASMQSDSHDPDILAAPKVTTLASTSAATGATIDVAAVHGPGRAAALCAQSKPNRKPERCTR